MPMLQKRMLSIKERAERIGLSLPELCKRSGVDQSTVYRWLHGRGARVDTFDVNVSRLEAELEKAELEALRYLRSLPHLKE